MDTGQLLYRPEEGAAMLRVSRSRLFQLLASGQLQTVQIGKSRRISRAALEEYIAHLEQTATPAAS